MRETSPYGIRRLPSIELPTPIRSIQEKIHCTDSGPAAKCWPIFQRNGIFSSVLPRLKPERLDVRPLTTHYSPLTNPLVAVAHPLPLVCPRRGRSRLALRHNGPAVVQHRPKAGHAKASRTLARS